jgi:intergrase/recombinase
MVENPKASFRSMVRKMNNKRYTEWVNLGGQIMQNEDLKELRRDIGSGKLKKWDDIHKRYDDLWVKYSGDKQKHAYAVLCELYGSENLTKDDWTEALDKAVVIQSYICDQVYLSRKKDFDNPFRHTTFRNSNEMKAAYGSLDENSFIVQVRQETADFKTLAEQIKNRN